MQGSDGVGLEFEVDHGHVLGHFPDASGEGQFGDEQFGGLLVFSDLSQCDEARTPPLHFGRTVAAASSFLLIVDGLSGRNALKSLTGTGGVTLVLVGVRVR